MQELTAEEAAAAEVQDLLARRKATVGVKNFLSELLMKCEVLVYRLG